ncbi:MAG: hypothetical protein PHW33_01885 [Candidatus Portnoybacteria bacterium]|jgi:hypothetical protein|nr:hypothetical protein [Candidatus Portnoybacteria bacterium]
MTNLKKVFLISLVLLALISGTFLTYNLFFKSDSGSSPTEEETGTLPENGTGADTGQSASISPAGQSLASLKLKAISQEKALAPTLKADGQSVKFYSQTTGQVWQTSFDGLNPQIISSKTLSGLIKIIWSPDKEKVVSVVSENGTIKKYFYNYATGQSSPLNSNIGFVAFSPDSKKIAYQYTDPQTGQSNISTSDPDGQNWKTVFKTRLANLVVEWPSKEKISIKSQPSGLSQGFLYSLNSETGEFANVLSGYLGLNAKWSPKADKILCSIVDQNAKNPKLLLTDSAGQQTSDLGLAGLVDKCVWAKDNRTVFCALPQQISANATWPDDYYKGLVLVNDDFYKINLETGKKTKIAGSSIETGYDAQDLFLSPQEDYLFFVNRRDGLLYSLKL